MPKRTKFLLLALAGVVALTIVSFSLSQTMQQNSRDIVFLLSHPYTTASTNPSLKPRNEVGSASTSSDGPQGNNGSTTATPQQGGIAQATSSTPEKNNDTSTDASRYRNDEFGFEFTIPDGWRVEENPYSGPYSYFNLILVPSGKKASYLDAFLINIVKPEFVEMSFYTLKPSDVPIMVDDVKGTKYEYPFEGVTNIDFILPRSKNTFIIEFQRENDDIFNEAVSSFKFLK